MQRIGTDCNYKGEPGIIYSTEETEFLASRLKFTLVGKFSHGLPNLNFLRNRIVKLGLKGSVNVGRLNFKHVLIRLNNEEDFSRLWLRGEWTFDNFHMRVFKWSPDFDPHTESPIAPVWIKLPGLPVHLFEKNALFTVAAKIGKPLRMDEPTADLSRPDLARVCVEIDLTAPKVQAVHLQINGKTYRQQVIYENCPPYCTFCNHLGHDMSVCISKHYTGANLNEKEPRTTGHTSSTNEDTRDLRDIINFRRKGKAVVIDPVVSNIAIHDSEAIVSSPNANVHNDNDAANGVFLPHMHVPATKLHAETSRPGHVEKASPDDFNYEDPLISELLDKDWDAEKMRQNVPHFIDIEAEEERHKESDRDTPSMVPNSLSDEIPSKAVGQTKNFFRGETSRQRRPDNKPTKEHTPASESEGEEELTPVSNRFQSLEDMETDDISHLIESTGKNTPLMKNCEAGGSKAEIQGHCSGENRYQEMILTDSTILHRHKRNKSLEENMTKSFKTGGKGKKNKGNISPKLLTRRKTRSSASSSPHF
ncbi:UNVERIFIED_CONTAM: hypothetical protein Sradi_7109000 [Sesamum radiatum]|uniref:DUF4283 domain-containing protein n=1 Tax=Sesamum radiatum TaxID=300843 RepID=A0AAW2J113_SESRA